MLADCLHELAALGPEGVAPVLVAMLLAGLAGGATHCAGMCGPFVIAQVTASSAHQGGAVLTRLGGAALAPYHAGRMLGYSLLGAVAGGGAGALSQASGLRHFLGAMLLLAALLMVRQAVGRFPAAWRLGRGSVAASAAQAPRPGAGAAAWHGRLDRWLAARPTWARWPAWRPMQPSGLLVAAIRRRLEEPGGWNGIGLGLLLSGLPCALLYAALAAAAATGSALAGALAMLAFTLGTVPSLLGVALLGRFFLRRIGSGVRLAGAALFLLNGALLAATAFRMFA